MVAPHFLTGIDIGSSHIRIAVGQVDENGLVNIIGTATVLSEGVHRGVVTNIDDSANCLLSALESADRFVGHQTTEAFVSVNGSHILTQNSHGVIAVAKPDGEIGSADVERVLEAAKAVVVPSNVDFLDILPHHYTVDGAPGIDDPVGMTGVRLEVKAHIIYGQSAHLKNLIKVVNKTGVDVSGLVFGILASATAILNKNQKQRGVCLVNIGAATTSLVVYEEGHVLHTAVLPVGSGHITNDIAICQRTSIETAEALKLKYGACVVTEGMQRHVLRAPDITPGEELVVRQSEVVEVIASRVEEILKMIQKELKIIRRDGMLPSGIVFTGGGANLPGLLDEAKEVLKLPTSLGLASQAGGSLESLRDPALTTAIGLVMWPVYNFDTRMIGGTQSLHTVDNVISGMVKWFKQLLP